MSDIYQPIHTFCHAAGIEFATIGDALIRANALENVVSTVRDPKTNVVKCSPDPKEKGFLPPAQVVAQFRTLEMDNLHAAAVQCAAQSPLKEILLPLLARVMKKQFGLREKAIEAEDAGSGLPGEFVEEYCHALADLRRYVGIAPMPQVAPAADEADKRTQPATIWYHGGRSYSNDQRNPKTVGREMHNLLKSFLGREEALDYAMLEERGVGNVTRAVQNVERKFGEDVTRPRMKKGDGYFFRVRNLPGKLVATK
jgi:hypothetical protein